MIFLLIGWYISIAEILFMGGIIYSVFTNGLILMDPSYFILHMALQSIFWLPEICYYYYNIYTYNLNHPSTIQDQDVSITPVY